MHSAPAPFGDDVVADVGRPSPSIDARPVSAGGRVPHQRVVPHPRAPPGDVHPAPRLRAVVINEVVPHHRRSPAAVEAAPLPAGCVVEELVAALHNQIAAIVVDPRPINRRAAVDATLPQSGAEGAGVVDCPALAAHNIELLDDRRHPIGNVDDVPPPPGVQLRNRRLRAEVGRPAPLQGQTLVQIDRRADGLPADADLLHPPAVPRHLHHVRHAGAGFDGRLHAAVHLRPIVEHGKTAPQFVRPNIEPLIAGANVPFHIGRQGGGWVASVNGRRAVQQVVVPGGGIGKKRVGGDAVRAGADAAVVSAAVVVDIVVAQGRRAVADVDAAPRRRAVFKENGVDNQRIAHQVVKAAPVAAGRVVGDGHIPQRRVAHLIVEPRPVPRRRVGEHKGVAQRENLRPGVVEAPPVDRLIAVNRIRIKAGHARPVVETAPILRCLIVGDVVVAAIKARIASVVVKAAPVHRRVAHYVSVVKTGRTAVVVETAAALRGRVAPQPVVATVVRIAGEAGRTTVIVNAAPQLRRPAQIGAPLEGRLAIEEVDHAPRVRPARPAPQTDGVPVDEGQAFDGRADAAADEERPPQILGVNRRPRLVLLAEIAPPAARQVHLLRQNHRLADGLTPHHRRPHPPAVAGNEHRIPRRGHVHRILHAAKDLPRALHLRQTARQLVRPNVKTLVYRTNILLEVNPVAGVRVARIHQRRVDRQVKIARPDVHQRRGDEETVTPHPRVAVGARWRAVGEEIVVVHQNRPAAVVDAPPLRARRVAGDEGVGDEARPAAVVDAPPVRRRAVADDRVVDQHGVPRRHVDAPSAAGAVVVEDVVLNDRIAVVDRYPPPAARRRVVPQDVPLHGRRGAAIGVNAPPSPAAVAVANGETPNGRTAVEHPQHPVAVLPIQNGQTGVGLALAEVGAPAPLQGDGAVDENVRLIVRPLRHVDRVPHRNGIHPVLHRLARSVRHRAVVDGIIPRRRADVAVAGDGVGDDAVIEGDGVVRVRRQVFLRGRQQGEGVFQIRLRRRRHFHPHLDEHHFILRQGVGVGTPSLIDGLRVGGAGQ